MMLGIAHWKEERRWALTEEAVEDAKDKAYSTDDGWGDVIVNRDLVALRTAGHLRGEHRGGCHGNHRGWGGHVRQAGAVVPQFSHLTQMMTFAFYVVVAMGVRVAKAGCHGQLLLGNQMQLLSYMSSAGIGEIHAGRNGNGPEFDANSQAQVIFHKTFTTSLPQFISLSLQHNKEKLQISEQQTWYHATMAHNIIQSQLKQDLISLRDDERQ